MSGGNWMNDLMSGLQLAAGVGATAFGQPGIGLGLAGSGLSGLTGSGQPGATGLGGMLGSAQGTGTPGSQSPLQSLNAIAPAAQSIMNAMGLNPQQRPQGASAQQQMPQPAPMGNRQQVNLTPQLQPPAQAAGSMPNVTAGAGSMIPASSMPPTGGVVNPQLQQILAMLGIPQ